ncbi:MAG: hypothetical protein NVS1B11_12140 [Terriglobales bacterium]
MYKPFLILHATWFSYSRIGTAALGKSRKETGLIVNAIARFGASETSPMDAVVLSAAFYACAGGMAVAESGRIVYANSAFAQTFGMFHGSQLEGRALAELFPQVPSAGFRMENSAYGHSVLDSSRIREDGKRVLVQATYAEFHVDARELLMISTREISQQERVKQ